MPGVDVITSARSGATVSTQVPSGTFFLAGQTERGVANEAVLVQSLAEFENRFGGRVTYGTTWDAVKTFFEEGGSRAYVVRVVGDAATIGTVTLNDRDDTTPAPTLRVDAKGAGAWSANVTVEVEDGTVADTFKLRFTLGDVFEVYDNLLSPVDAVNRVNPISNLVTLTDLGSATAAPANIPEVNDTSLSAGADDRAAIVAADYVAALDAHAPNTLGTGAVAVPGQTAGAVATGLIAHAKTTGRIALLAPAQGSTSADALAAAGTLRGTLDSEYAGLFYPWVKVPDGGLGTRTISPEAYVAAVRARAHRTDGPYRAPAGKIAEARYVVGVETEIDRATGDQLDAAEVNAIRTIANTVRLYGWRSLSSDEDNYAMLTARDTLNYLARQGEIALEDYVFRAIDSRGHLFSELVAEITGIVEPMRARGGIYEKVDETGELIDDGYSVDAGPNVNTPTTLAQNKARVALAVRVAPTGALIELLITKVGLNAAL